MATTARSFASASSERISLGNPTNLQITGALTICCWVNFTTISGSATGIVMKQVTGGVSYALYIQNTTTLSFNVSGDGSAEPGCDTTGITFNTGQWYRIGCIYVPSTSCTIYVDNVQRGFSTTSIPASIFNSSSNVLIGCRSNATQWFLNGAVKGVSIYNVAKSQAEVDAILTSGPPASFANLQAWLDLDGFLSPEPDFSGNGYHGTLTGTTQTTGPTGYTQSWPYPIAAGAEGSAASGNITLGAPASPSTNDVWVAVVHSADQVAHTFTDWTQVFQANGGGTTSRLSVWEFRYAGSTPNLVVGHTSGGTIVGGIVAFRGCRTTGSAVIATSAGGAGTDASIEFSNITPANADTMLLACDGAADANNRSTLPTGHYAHLSEAGPTNAYLSTAASPGGSVSAHSRFWASGATSGLVDTQAAADPWTSVLLALTAVTPTAVLVNVTDLLAAADTQYQQV